MASTSSRTVTVNLGGRLDSASRASADASISILEILEEFRATANKLGLRQPVARITVSLEAANGDTAKVYRTALEVAVAEYSSTHAVAPLYAVASTRTLLDFRRKRYQHDGREIYLTAYEQLALFKILFNEPPLTRELTQALYRIRRRIGKEFLA